MKKALSKIHPKGWLLMLLISLFCGCDRVFNQQDDGKKDLLSDYFSEEISVKSPMPSKQINHISLSQSQKKLVRGYNDFAFDLLDSLYASKGGKSSFVFSPFSVYMDLAMVANATNGEAREELYNAFRLEEDDSKLNSFCNTLLEELPAVDLSSSMKIANAIIVDKFYPVRESFKRKMEEVFYGVVESLPFEKWDLVTARINKWVNECTEGLIPTMLDAYEVGSIAYLLNALYFKAEMAYPFDSKLTIDRHFHLPEAEVPISFMEGQFELSYETNDVFSAISLPLGNGKFRMSIFLPHEEHNVVDVIPQMRECVYYDPGKQLVFVGLPKFKTESSFDLQSVLKQLGISAIFGPCDFQPMLLETVVPIRVSSVLHKATISVNESGIEAAGATSVGTSGISPAEQDRPVYRFIADRPFVYIIQEQSSGMVLFTGVFNGN